MKTQLTLLFTALLFITASALADVARPVLQSSSTKALVDDLGTGAKKITVSAAGTLEFANGFTLTGGGYLKAALALGNVENVALSGWAGSSNITTIGTLSAGAVPTTLLTGTITNAQLAGSIAASKLVGTDIATVGTISTGTWHGTAIGDTYISSAATWNAKQAAYANLTAFGSLANAAGVLTNNGSGTFSYTGTSTGLNGNADAGKLVKYDTNGVVNADALNTYSVNIVTDFGGGLIFQNIGGAYAVQLRDASAVTGTRIMDLSWPDADTSFAFSAGGTVLTTGNLSLNTPAESSVTFTDITTNNASTSKHGYLRKLDNNAAHYLDGTGGFSTPSTATNFTVTGDLIAANIKPVSNIGFYSYGFQCFGTDVNYGLLMTRGNLTVPYAGGISWLNSSTYAAESSLQQVAAGKVFHKYGANGCYFAVTNTYTSTSNYEAGVFDWMTTANKLRIGSDVGSGGGTARDVQLIRGGVVKTTIGANTTDHAQPVKVPSYIASGITSAATCGVGSIACVTDALTPVVGSAVTGGGSIKVLVCSNGTDWIVIATL